MKINLKMAILKTLLLKLLLIHCLVSSSAKTNNITDEYALLAFKSQLTFEHGNDPLEGNWTTNASFCNWFGVSCSTSRPHRQQRVTALNLSFAGIIQGTISPYIGNLSFLTFLNLQNNSLGGHLPESLGRLRRLRALNLGYNHFGGVIPSSLSQCQRLQRIILLSNQLRGTIPVTLGDLHGLEILELSQNLLSGTVPMTIFNISTLWAIDIHTNNLSGGIPATLCHKLPRLEFLFTNSNPSLGGPLPTSLCQCARLQQIDFGENSFTGSIPNDIGCLSNLYFLGLGNNLLTGHIPPSVGNLSRLWSLDLRRNHLSGGIPRELAQLSNIQDIIIAGNKLISGRIPGEIFNLTSLQLLSFRENNLTGSIPETTGIFLPNLQNLHLRGNRLSGEIPSSISNASKLTLLVFSNNHFSGSVPMTLGNLQFLETLFLQCNQLSNDPSKTELDILTSLTKCRQLRYLNLGRNPLKATLPASIGNLSMSLELFAIYEAQITGNIPTSIGNLSNLLTLFLPLNDLSGTIPPSVGNMVHLQGLHLFKNKLHGLIPNELCQSTALGELYLFRNRLSSSIPSCIGNLTSTAIVDISHNSLTSIPLQVWSLTNIRYLDLSHNSLTGNLPLEIEKLMGLTMFNVSNNQLKGTIPSTISNLKMLMALELSDNAFQGTIPETIGSLASLEYLNLCSNSLSGEVPKSFENLQYLNYLNLSFNNLSGEVPIGGLIGNFTAQSFMGNDELCGPPKLQLPACKIKAHQKSRRVSKWLKYILPPVASVIILVGLMLVFIKHRVERRKNTPSNDLSVGTTLRFISYYELKRATNNFCEANLLGVGSLGSVYKGALADGTIVAIKVLNLQVEIALKSFDAECRVLRNVRHRNLVKIVTSCSNLDFRALVLQFMPNGSLDMLLHSQEFCLDILQRMNIMIDVALGVEYLHHGCSEPIVHCDLKPSNVLLDENMIAQVGDFGIAKFMAKYKSLTQTETLGTVGYIAPEFGSEGRVSTKGDVFSYGIMLMETFTGKKPTNDMFGAGSSLRQWVHSSFPTRLLEVVDINMLAHREQATGETADPLHGTLAAILEMALHCTNDFPGDRLTMTDIVVRLKKFKQQFLMHP